MWLVDVDFLTRCHMPLGVSERLAAYPALMSPPRLKSVYTICPPSFFFKNEKNGVRATVSNYCTITCVVDCPLLTDTARHTPLPYSKMGVDCGFDVYPPLSRECQGLYKTFLEEVIQKYKEAVHPNTGETLIRIVGIPGTQNAYIYFNVGEGPLLPYNVDYFMRFASKLVRRDNVMPYLKEVYLIARRYFPDNVQFWVSGSSPTLIQRLHRIPNMREEEGPPHVGDKWYEVRDGLFRLGRELEQGTQDEEGVGAGPHIDSPDDLTKNSES